MFLEDYTGTPHEVNGCLGCEIANGTLKYAGCDIYKGQHFGVMQDFELPINGFIIIAPNRHVEQFSELTAEEISELGTLILKTLNALKQLKVADYFDLISEEKENRHLHIWLVPKPEWMTKQFGKVLKNIKEIQQYALDNLKTPENISEIKKTCENLKKLLNKTTA